MKCDYCKHEIESCDSCGEYFEVANFITHEEETEAHHCNKCLLRTQVVK